MLSETLQFSYSSPSLVGDDGEKISTLGGFIDIKFKNTVFSPRKQSIVNFVVDDNSKGKGIGKKLIKHALTRHDDLGGQASSAASVKALYDCGFRNPQIPNGSFQDHLAKMKDDSSVYMAHKDDSGTAYVS